MTRATLAALGLALSGAVGGIAETVEGVTRALTLDEAVRRALEAHPVLLQGDIDVRLAELRVDRAQSGRRPLLNASGLSKVGLSGAGTLLGLQGLAASPEPEGLAASGNVVQDVLDFNRSGLEREARRAELDSFRHTLMAEEAQLVRDVRAAYHSAASAIEQVRADETAVEARALASKGARSRLRAGLASGLDVRDAEAKLARAKREMEEARDSMRLAHARLSAAIGDGSSQPRTLEGSGKLPGTPPPLEPLLATSLERRPELAAVDARARAGEIWVKRAERSRYPRVMVMFSGGWARFAELTLSNLLFGGFGIQLPLLSQGQIRTSIEEAKLALERTQAVREELVRAIRLEVVSSRSALVAALESHRSAATEAERARDADRLAGARHANGLVSSLERAVSRSDLAREESALTGALSDVAIAHARLEFAIGDRTWQRPSPPPAR